MQNFPVGVFLKKDGFSMSMLIAHGDIIVKSKFDGWCDFSALTDFFDDNILPLVLSSLIVELHEDSVEIFIY